MAYYDPYGISGALNGSTPLEDQAIVDQISLEWEGEEAANQAAIAAAAAAAPAAAASINTPYNYSEIHSNIPKEFQRTTSTEYGDTPSHAATYNPYSKRYYDAASGNLYALNDDLTVNYNKIISGPGEAQSSSTPISTQGWTAQDWQGNASKTDDREGKIQIDGGTGDVYVWVDGGLHYLGNQATGIESQNTFMTNYYQKKAEVEEVVKGIEGEQPTANQPIPTINQPIRFPQNTFNSPIFPSLSPGLFNISGLYSGQSNIVDNNLNGLTQSLNQISNSQVPWFNTFRG